MVRNVLVTGFGPFGSIKQNPTEIIANRLHHYFIDENTQIIAKVLPVTDEGVSSIQQDLHRFCCILHLGVDSSHSVTTLVELCAWNYKACHVSRPEPLDSDSKRGDMPSLQPIFNDAPWLLPTTVNLQSTDLNRLVQSSIKGWSRDAGTYYCNEVYFRSLWSLRQNNSTCCDGKLIPCLFIHIPLNNDIQQHVDYIIKIIKAIVD